MEIPDNCQCYCYAIMSSLCFPCQVKIHLLHLTASPHGEVLTKNMKCPTTETRSHSLQFRIDPKDRSQTPQSTGKNSIPTTTSPNTARTDCDKCYYYMNFINKLTSGLCEEKIMRMVCSNPCLISSDLPAAPGDRSSDSPPPKPSRDVPPFTHTMDNVIENKANNQRNPSKTSARSNTSTDIKAEEHPVPGLAVEETTTMVFVNNQVPANNHSSKDKLGMSPDKKPTTPTNLMTTDKMLRKSFDSRNRTSPITSRSPSPVNKHPEIKQTTNKQTKVDYKLTRNYNATKNDSRQAKNDFRIPTFQRNPLNSTLGKAPKNEPTSQHQMVGKEVGKITSNSNGRKSAASGKIKSGDTPKTRTAPRNFLATAKMASKPLESAPESLINAGEGNRVQFVATERTTKTAENVKGQSSGAMEMRTNKLDGRAGFYEAELIMEFYQPPQLGSKNRGTTPAAKQLHMENEIRNKTKYYNQRELREQKGGKKQQTTRDPTPPVEYAIAEEDVEFLPPVDDDMTSCRNKKPGKLKPSNSSTKKEVLGEDKARKKSRTSDSKRHNAPSWRGTSQAPISAQVRNHKAFYTNDTAPCDKPVQDNDMIGRDMCKYEPDFEQTHFDNAGQRDESGRYPISTGRNVKDQRPQGACPNKGIADVNDVRRTPESQRNSMYNNTNKVDKQRYEYSSLATYMTEGMEPVNYPKNAEEDTPKWKDMVVGDAREIIPGAPHGMEYIPNGPQTNRKDRLNSKTNANDKDRNQVDRTEPIGEPTTPSEVLTNGPRGCLHIDEPSDESFSTGVVRKIREEIESEYRQKLVGNQEHDPKYDPKPKKRFDETQKPLTDAIPSPSYENSSRPGSPIQKKSKSPNQCHGSASCTSMDDVTKVYPQFSEYMNPDVEGYRSKSVGNVAKTQSAHDGTPPAKSRSERGSSKWNCGVCPEDKRVYYHTDSNGKCTSMVIGLPQDGRDSNPHIRINFSKQIKQEKVCHKVDKCEQKNDYRDTGTQCDNDILEVNSPAGSRPATAKSSNNRISPKTSAKPLQASGQISTAKPTQASGHQQMYYNRPLMRRSFQ